MTTQKPRVSPQTEMLLGPWSLTALAALLVAGGILWMIPGNGHAALAEHAASQLHPVKLPSKASVGPKAQLALTTLDVASPVDGAAAKTTAVRAGTQTAESGSGQGRSRVSEAGR